MSMDDAIDNCDKHIVPLEHNFQFVLAEHLSNQMWHIPTSGVCEEFGNETTYHNVVNFWEDNIFVENHYHGKRVILESFFLFEWIPRSPGLYFTDFGRESRKKAKNEILSVSDGAVTYSPHGKACMLKGGVGNIRLAPLRQREGIWFFCSASDSGICHQGIPVAISEKDYKSSIDEIRSRGAKCCTLIGELRFIPDDYKEMYDDYHGVEKFYLAVEKIAPASFHKSRSFSELSVSAAVTFRGNYEGIDNIFATYVNFNPSNRGDIARALDWMENVYVKSYNGEILTDFDAQKNRFSNASFSLRKTMELELSQNSFQTVVNNFHITAYQAQKFIQNQRTVYKISGGNIAAVGDNAISIDARFAPKSTR